MPGELSVSEFEDDEKSRDLEVKDLADSNIISKIIDYAISLIIISENERHNVQRREEGKKLFALELQEKEKSELSEFLKNDILGIKSKSYNKKSLENFLKEEEFQAFSLEIANALLDKKRSRGIKFFRKKITVIEGLTNIVGLTSEKKIRFLAVDFSNYETHPNGHGMFLIENTVIGNTLSYIMKLDVILDPNTNFDLKISKHLIDMVEIKRLISLSDGEFNTEFISKLADDETKALTKAPRCRNDLSYQEIIKNFRLSLRLKYDENKEQLNEFIENQIHTLRSNNSYKSRNQEINLQKEREMDYELLEQKNLEDKEAKENLGKQAAKFDIDQNQQIEEENNAVDVNEQNEVLLEPANPDVKVDKELPKVGQNLEKPEQDADEKPKLPKPNAEIEQKNLGKGYAVEIVRQKAAAGKKKKPDRN